MKCPKCDSVKTQVLETRKVDGGVATRRTRSCDCGATFPTYEVDGGIWRSIERWVLLSHAAALAKQRVLRKRNAQIVTRVRQGELRKDIAQELGLSQGMVSTITTRARLPRKVHIR